MNNTSDENKGKVYTKTELVLFDEKIITFHEKYYKDAIDKLAYHLPHVKILGTNHVGLTRRNALLLRRDKKT